ncbi:MAG: thioesterase family protein [Acidimicrobiales bacterium]|nr:thioesterase family protein [Acidimicrobiales bacterium]
MPATRFDRDTDVRSRGDGVFEGRIDRGWWIERGPNGGYVAALVLQALAGAVDDPDRSPRSLTVHYLAPPREGPVRVETAIERQGRSLTFVSGRLSQDDRLLATAVAAFAIPMPGPTFSDIAMPDAVPLDRAEPLRLPAGTVPMRDRYESRWAVGHPPFSGAPQAVAGGWIRLVEPRPVDAPVVTALTDAWMPPVFSRFSEPMAVPTVDLTVHFRTALPHPGMADDDFCLTVFRSQVAAGGFIEEDGEVWSPDGVLLAHSRQLAVLLPVG